MGPRRTKLTDKSDMRPPPFQVVDKEQTWLDKTDLVFIDPVGTGYSRAKSVDIARRMNGVKGRWRLIADSPYSKRSDHWCCLALA
jgi:carboxypeptidase C (cathepsin A)